MHLQHDLRSGLSVFIEVFLHDHHDKFHWREIVIEQDNLIHGRRFQLFFLPLQYGAILLVWDNRHTPILNNSAGLAILRKTRPTGWWSGPPNGEPASACALRSPRLPASCAPSRRRPARSRLNRTETSLPTASSIAQSVPTFPTPPCRGPRATLAEPHRTHLSRLCDFSRAAACASAQNHKREKP